LKNYIDKVAAILEFKYDIDRDLTYNYEPEINLCQKNDYTPRRTAEYVAFKILDLKQ
jgi:hypothetical protein